MYKRILVPVDGSATSNRGLSEAIQLAKLVGARLRLIHVVDELSLATAMESAAANAGQWLDLLREGGEQLLDQALGTARTAGIEADTCMLDSLSGAVPSFILDEARRWQADLIVLGTHGRRGPKRWLLGSTAETVVRQATIPVLLVRSEPGFDEILEEGQPESARAGQPEHASQPSQALAFE